MKKCDYCGREEKEKDIVACRGCGAKLPEPVNIERGEPFFYRGYIIYCIRDWSRDVRIVQFWLGDRLVDTIETTSETLRELVPEYEDAMPFFYDLLKVSQGEAEVLRIERQNIGRPALFEIRRIATEREKDAAFYKSLSREQLYQALKQG